MRGDGAKPGAGAGPECGGKPRGSRAGGGPPSIDDIDMELPVLPDRVRELNAGSSRPDGKALGGPLARDGARGGGGP
jgi:hypothetical protein